MNIKLNKIFKDVIEQKYNGHSYSFIRGYEREFNDTYEEDYCTYDYDDWRAGKEAAILDKEKLQKMFRAALL